MEANFLQTFLPEDRRGFVTCGGRRGFAHNQIRRYAMFSGQGQDRLPSPKDRLPPAWRQVAAPQDRLPPAWRQVGDRLCRCKLTCLQDRFSRHLTAICPLVCPKMAKNRVVLFRGQNPRNMPRNRICAPPFFLSFFLTY